MSDSKKPTEPVQGLGQQAKPAEPQPGDGIRSVKTMNFFRVLNFELYAKPVSFIMNLHFMLKVRAIIDEILQWQFEIYTKSIHLHHIHSAINTGKPIKRRTLHMVYQLLNLHCQIQKFIHSWSLSYGNSRKIIVFHNFK